jgi:hypothetical protein
MGKMKDWIRRYGLAEIFGLVGTVVFAKITYHFSGNLIISAFAGSMGENFGYYGYILYREFKYEIYTGSHILKLAKRLRNLLFEFGPAETLDLFISRPFFLTVLPKIVGDYTLGIIAGKIISDIVFYAITIPSYEARKKLFKTQSLLEADTTKL